MWAWVLKHPIVSWVIFVYAVSIIVLISSVLNAEEYPEE